MLSIARDTYIIFFRKLFKGLIIENLRYRISDTGDVKLYSIARTLDIGSDVS